MTPILCARALAAFLTKCFGHYTPPDDEIAAHGITVVDGFLPRQTTADAKSRQNPYIVVRPVKVDDAEEGSTVDLQLLVSTYDDDKAEGHLALYHILEFIRQCMLQYKLIDNRYMLQMPLKTIIPEEQPFPQWWGYLEATYSIGQPGLNIFANGGEAVFEAPSINASYGGME